MGDLFFPLSVNQLFSKLQINLYFFKKILSFFRYLIFDPTAEEELFSDYAITFFLNVVTSKTEK